MSQASQGTVSGRITCAVEEGGDEPLLLPREVLEEALEQRLLQGNLVVELLGGWQAKCDPRCFVGWAQRSLHPDYDVTVQVFKDPQVRWLAARETPYTLAPVGGIQAFHREERDGRTYRVIDKLLLTGVSLVPATCADDPVARLDMYVGDGHAGDL